MPDAAGQGQALAEPLLLEQFGHQERQLDRLLGVEPRIAIGVVAVAQIGSREMARAPPMHSVTFWPVISRCTPPA